jgi:hypothetical protein
MKKLSIAVAMGLTLAGCVSAQDERNAQIQAGVQQAVAACQARKFSSYVANARCIAEAEAPLTSTLGPVADLHTLKLTQRIAIAERVDRGQLTHAQALAEIAQVDAVANSEAQRRIGAIQAVQAQQQAAMAASNAALAASRPVTCYRVSYLVNCY